MSDSQTRTIQMKDGRTVEFGEKTKMKKDYSVENGLVTCRIDFDNGETVQVSVDPASAIGAQALGHGLAQKLGDAAAGADTTEDAFESVLEVAARISKGEWTKSRAGEGGGSAKGASELVTALAEYFGKTKEQVREVLAGMQPADKNAIRKVPQVAAIIERLKAEKGPSKAEREKAAKGADLLAQFGAAPV